MMLARSSRHLLGVVLSSFDPLLLCLDIILSLIISSVTPSLESSCHQLNLSTLSIIVYILTVHNIISTQSSNAVFVL